MMINQSVIYSQSLRRKLEAAAIVAIITIAAPNVGRLDLMRHGAGATGDDVPCKCCLQNSKAGEQWHRFNQSAKVDSACLGGLEETYSKSGGSASRNISSEIPLDFHAPNEALESFSVDTRERSISNRVAAEAARGGGEEALCKTSSTSCRAKTLSGVPGQVDTMHVGFHPGPYPNLTCDSHNTCANGDPETLAMVYGALDRSDYSVLAQLVGSHGELFFVNEDRGLLQMLDCRGLIHAQTPIDMVRLSAAIERATRASLRNQPTKPQ
jgi:hypothetical protein